MNMFTSALSWARFMLTPKWFMLSSTFLGDAGCWLGLNKESEMDWMAFKINWNTHFWNNIFVIEWNVIEMSNLLVFEHFVNKAVILLHIFN